MPLVRKFRVQAEAGNILCNGKSVKSNYKIKPGDIVTIVLPHPPREIELIPEDIPLNIVYEEIMFFWSIRNQVWWFIRLMETIREPL